MQRRLMPLTAVAFSVLTIACSYGGHSGDAENMDVLTFTDGGVMEIRQSDDRDKEEVMSDSRSELKGVPGDYATFFNDSNYIQWRDAEKIGIDPLVDMHSYWNIKRPLVKVETCKDFYIEELTHSAPFLVPEAADALHEIGRRFHTLAREKTGQDYRIRVTSLTRSVAQIRRLQRSNKNSVDSSVHQLATTFDISYAGFADRNEGVVSHPELKPILAAVLEEQRRNGRIWVKYERKQPCFHISARK